MWLEMLSLEKQVFQFFSDYGHIEVIEKQCRRHNLIEQDQSSNKKNVMAVYKITLLIDTMELCDEYAELGNLVLHSPGDAWQTFHSVVFKIIQEMRWLPSADTVMTSSQLLLVLRLTTIPDLPGYTIEHLSDLPKITEAQRFTVYTGVVCGISMREKYTESACFHCSNNSCHTRTSGDKYIRMHITGHTEAMTVRGGLTCSHCQSPLSEDIAFRILSEKLMINMIPVQSLTTDAYCEKPIRYQSITVILRGELCNMVRIGEVYSIIGIPVYETEFNDGRTSIKTTLEANNILPVYNKPNTTCGSALTSSVMNIYKACSYSPWTFSATLTYSFAAHLFPPGIYHRLKLSLLLSIVVAKADTSGKKINMLVIGHEYYHGNQLLDYGASFLPRKVRHMMGMDLVGNARNEWMDAGSIPLSSRGVCIVQDIGSWKKDQKDLLSKVMEEKMVTIKSIRPLEAKVTRPLATTLWAISDIQRCQSMKKAQEESVANIPKHLIDHFDILATLDPPTMDNEAMVYSVLTDHLLQTVRGNPSIPPLTRNDYIKLFSLCSSLDVVLSPSADSLLKGYYLASRRARGTSSNSFTDTPKSAMDTLIIVTLAHARLSLHHEATEEDAVLAILLYEEGQLIRTGHSPLCVQPLPHVMNEAISEHIGSKFDCQMREFYKSVKRFIKNYAGAVDSLIPSFPPEE